MHEQPEYFQGISVHFDMVYFQVQALLMKLSPSQPEISRFRQALPTTILLSVL